MKNRKTKVRKLYNILLRILIVVATYGFLYKKVFLEKDFGHQLDILLGLFQQPGVSQLLWLVIFMMFVNWGIESQKWRYLISKIEKISFIKAYEAVLTGASVSFFTPNRVGEYFGRVFILDKAGHLEGVFITILGSLSQLLVTILTGTLALLLIHPQVVPEIQGYPGLLYYSLVGIIILLDTLLLFLYFNVSLLTGLKQSISKTRFRKYGKVFRIFKYYSAKELLFVITLSFTRYLVFSLQYFLLLKIFSVPIPFYNGMIIISLIFLIITVFPTVALTELGIRDSVAIYFFGLYFTQTGTMTDEVAIGVLSASTFLWLLNLAIPALTGTFFIYRLKFFRKRNTEEPDN